MQADGFEATASGSALKGESPICVALRELREETGIIATELIQIGIIPYFIVICVLRIGNSPL